MSRLPLPQPTPIPNAYGGTVLAYRAADMHAYSDASNAALRKQLNAAKTIIAGQNERSIHQAREHGELMQRASDVAGERAANAILTDENAALRAELEALRKQCADEDIRMLTMTEVDDLRAELERLTAERDALRSELADQHAHNEVLRADAERYRWLVDNGPDTFVAAYYNTNTPQEVDAAIDAARKATP